MNVKVHAGSSAWLGTARKLKVLQSSAALDKQIYIVNGPSVAGAAFSFLQSGGTSQERVCYQWGLPCLVLKGINYLIFWMNGKIQTSI